MLQTMSFLYITGPRKEDWDFDTVNYEDQLTMLQKRVGGYLTPIVLEKGLAVLCDQDGISKSLKPTTTWMVDGKVRDILLGNLVVLRVQGSGLISLQASDLPIIKRYLVPVIK